MEIGFDILENLEYNDVIVLKVIEADNLLKEVFYEEIKIPFGTLYESALNNTIDENTKEYMNRFFNSAILTDFKVIQNYKKFADELQIPIEVSPIFENEVIEDVTEEVTETTTKKSKKSKKAPKYPRRFRVDEVKEEIQKQGGKATLSQTAMISSNHLKNMNVKINNLLIRDSDKHLLSESDYLTIISTIRIVENKLKNVLKKK